MARGEARCGATAQIKRGVPVWSARGAGDALRSRNTRKAAGETRADRAGGLASWRGREASSTSRLTPMGFWPKLTRRQT